MAWRLTDDEHTHQTCASIQCLMLPAWRDLEPFAGLQNEITMFDFKGQLAFQDKEELP